MESWSTIVHRRRGFTLIELQVVIAIIALLNGAIVFFSTGMSNILLLLI
ncbi:MAG: prepilin-type N-terminal cleavage/methylation domain-containing protein [Planctomycetota bacterium]